MRKKFNILVLTFSMLYLFMALSITSAILITNNNSIKEFFINMNLPLNAINNNTQIAFFAALVLGFVIILLAFYTLNKELKKKEKPLYIVCFIIIYLLVYIVIFFSLFINDKENIKTAITYVLLNYIIGLLGTLIIFLLILLPIILFIKYNKLIKNSNEEKNLASINNKEVLSKEVVFPTLSKIDNDTYQTKIESSNLSLQELCEDFRNYLASNEQLYFDIRTIRTFIAALSASRLVILEGLSGTGKSSIARYFSEYISEESFFLPIQTTYRDRNSLLGFYNDFSKSYNETKFLERLYRNTFKPDNINIMVLDEMNISRVEYYFADFISIMEYPLKDWKLPIYQLPYGFIPPKHLEDGILQIPETTWFIGTANKDDSTYTITDKVYDRAITISFDERNTYFDVENKTNKIKLSYSKLISLFNNSKTEENILNEDDNLKFNQILDFIYNTFDITLGNRVLKQIEQFVPVYVLCGGTKEEALDFFISTKLLTKLQGRYEEYIKKGLNNLLDLINNIYNEESFSLSKKEINNLLRRF